MNKQKPIKKIRVGSISASVFENEAQTKKGKFKSFSVSLQKVYTDKEGKVKNTQCFNLMDLPKCIMALSKTFSELTIVEE